MFTKTPMLRQFKEIKDQYTDCILFYRLGDFYEMFGDDAELAARELEIVLTARDAGGSKKIPMCGVPYHAAENYIGKLIKKGYKVAICEQTEDPKKAKGIVKREVIRIITPGTLINENLLEEKNNNFLLSIYRSQKDNFALAAIDISTGEFYTTETEDEKKFINEIFKYNPAECITNESNLEFFKEKLSRYSNNIFINTHDEYAFKSDFSSEIILRELGIQSLKSIGLEGHSEALVASGAALDYLKYNQKTTLSNILSLKYYDISQRMILDMSTIKNLELFESSNFYNKNQSVLSIVDYTKTSMGARKLKSWLTQPLTDKTGVKERLAVTKSFKDNRGTSEEIREYLFDIYDLERILAKISFGSANGKDLIALKNSLEKIPLIKEALSGVEDDNFDKLNKRLVSLTELTSSLEQSLNPDPPYTIREGNIIRDGFNEEIDELRDIALNGKKWIAGLEQSEKEKLGIKSLKIGYNKVFGYFIEVRRTNLENIPDTYIRKQTLANTERYITPELKEMEAKVIGADDKLKKLEYELFLQIRNMISENYSKTIIENAKIISELDVFNSFAYAATKNNFTCPTINSDKVLEITSLRHPVVENNLDGEWFIPNDIYMDQNKENFILITGPNMGGKSTYCRSIAIAAILAQSGSFIPAKYAEIPIFDRVFARIGASDDLTTGQSTFMVEMNEVANIINNSTKDSLIILDEVGRGTSTYDGLSLAWSITEYISQNLKAKTLFATHYHELTELESKYENIANYSVSVEETDEKIVFLHKINRGKADKSYGIQVAELAGLPDVVINKAKSVLNRLEEKNNEYKQITIEDLFIAEDKPGSNEILVQTNPKHDEIISLIKETDLNQLTPIQAFNIFNNIKTEIQKEGL